MTESEIHRLPELLLACGNFDKIVQIVHSISIIKKEQGSQPALKKPNQQTR